jgi:predicted nucleic acid-binding protein
MSTPCTKEMPKDIDLVGFDGLGTPRINLSTSEDIRREMAKVYRETRCNKILPTNGTKLVYMLINILKAYEVTELEKRLVDLEKAHLKGDR